jgi:hypothetical protein
MEADRDRVLEVKPLLLLYDNDDDEMMKVVMVTLTVW